MGAKERYHKTRPKVVAVASDGNNCDWDTWIEYKHGFYAEQPFVRSVNHVIPCSNYTAYHCKLYI